MEVILVRHGSAEDRTLAQDDLKRVLTDEGKEDVRRLMDQVEKKLSTDAKGTRLIWASPANRAMETAHIISNELGIEQSTIHDWIYAGDFALFSKELSRLPDEATVFVVGHQPLLGQWYAHLTGEIRKIKKGMFLSITVQSLTPIVAQANWDLRP